jgi:hypothetical protein
LGKVLPWIEALVQSLVAVRSLLIDVVSRLGFKTTQPGRAGTKNQSQICFVVVELRILDTGYDNDFLDGLFRIRGARD